MGASLRNKRMARKTTFAADALCTLNANIFYFIFTLTNTGGMNFPHPSGNKINVSLFCDLPRVFPKHPPVFFFSAFTYFYLIYSTVGAVTGL